MKVLNTFLAATILAVSANTHADTNVTENDIGRFLPKCAAPVASVAVGKFSCKAQSCNKPHVDPRMAGLLALAQASGSGTVMLDFSSIGDGMGNALTTALKATNCFEIQEREALDDLKKEMELAGIKLEAKPAEFMISGVITSVGMETKKSSFGAGLIPIVGGISSTKNKANLAMDIRVIDVKKASVRESKSFDANSESKSWGVAGGGLIGAGGLFGSHSVSKSPEMDRIASETVIHATEYLVNALAGDKIVSRPVVLAQTAKDDPKHSEAKEEVNAFGF